MLLNAEAIFSPLEIGPAVALNRLMRSATYESASDRDGLPDFALMTRLYGDLAQGGVGLIVIGHTYVHPSGRAGLKQNGMQSDDHALAWETILADVRKHTDAPIFVQLTYAGRKGYKAGEFPDENDKRERFAPGGTPFEAWFERQIEAVIGAFGKAAARAVKAGFDGVQIHLAHGFLLSECLSLATNKRRDTWGGDDPANRRRLPMAVVDCVREAIGTKLALAVKLNGSDHNPPEGVEPAEAAETARELEARGVQLIEVSSGTPAQKVTGPDTEAYLLPEAREVAAKVGCRVATVGGYRTVPTILKALGEGLDMVSLCRPLIREPDLPVQIRRDAGHAATCVSCDKCFDLGGGAVRCMIDHPGAPLASGK
jgi:2,4-dienoyl-CoA reductase-like NADH-dependent reductase (Old Yellow Enzyme family)